MFLYFFVLLVWVELMLNFLKIAETIDWEVLCVETVNLHHIHSILLGSAALGFHHLTNTSSLGCYAWTDQQLFVLLEEISS